MASISITVKPNGETTTTQAENAYVMHGMTRVYWNRHKHLWSVQQLVNSRWKVVGHASSVWLVDAQFHVSQKGRQRVLKTGVRNVHAYVEGYLEQVNDNNILASSVAAGIGVTYNPFQHDTFVTRATNREVWAAASAFFIDTGKCYVIGYRSKQLPGLDVVL